MVLCVHEIAQDELFDTVADGVHTTGPVEVVGSFEFFRDALDLCVLPDEVVVHIPRVPIEVDQALLERFIHMHYVDYSRALDVSVELICNIAYF